jgi:hypothetical protein
MQCYEEVDAICSVQSRRVHGTALFTMIGADGRLRGQASMEEFARNLTPVLTGHFGLTLFRVSALKEMPRPWFMPEPNAEKRWGENRVDADMAFWKAWHIGKKTLCVANRVIVGHIQELITWPDATLKPIYQPVMEYDQLGMPAGVMRMTAEEQCAMLAKLEESKQ